MPKKIHFIDFETHRFAPHNMAPPIVCMSWFSSGDAVAGLELWVDARRRLKTMLREVLDGRAILVAHNAAYDFSCVIAQDPELAPMVWAAYAMGGIECTRIREKLLDIRDRGLLPGSKKNKPYSLEKMCQRHLGTQLDKGADGWRLRYAELDGVPVAQWPERAVVYAKDDSALGFKIYYLQEQRMASHSYTCPTQHLDARASLALRMTSIWGVTTDVARASKLQTQIQTDMKGLQTGLLNAGFLKLDNPTMLLFQNLEEKMKKSMPAIRNAVVNSWPQGLGDVPLTDAGAIKTNKDTLEMCTHPSLESLVKFTSLQKTLSTYVPALLEGIVHANFNELVNSGRTSCSKINLQNQPRMPGVRECFISRKGRVLLASDYSSQELRFLAQAQLNIVGSSRLATFYQNDPHFDPHQAFADGAGLERQPSKIGNFGLAGGMGIGGLMRFAKSYGQTWTYDFTKEVRDAYFIQWAEMDDFFGFVRSVVNGSQRLTIPQSGMEMGEVGYCDASNRLFQTPAAHASKSAHFEAVRRCYDPSMRSPLLGSRPWNFVHDEIILETPEFAVDVAAPELERVMEDAMQPWCPDVPCVAEATPMVRWSKNAKIIKDSKGHYTPWDEGMAA